MKRSRFFIPQGIQCNNLNNKINIFGSKGKVPINFSKKFKQKTNIVCFKSKLTTYENASFKQAALGACLKYKIEIVLKGIGFNVIKKDNHLSLNLNYSHPITISIPSVIFIEIRKKTIYMSSSHFDLLKNFARKIRQYRSPNPYKEKGIFYKDEHFVGKEGKKI